MPQNIAGVGNTRTFSAWWLTLQELGKWHQTHEKLNLIPTKLSYRPFTIFRLKTLLMVTLGCAHSGNKGVSLGVRRPRCHPRSAPTHCLTMGKMLSLNGLRFSLVVNGDWTRITGGQSLFLQMQSKVVKHKNGITPGEVWGPTHLACPWSSWGNLRQLWGTQGSPQHRMEEDKWDLSLIWYPTAAKFPPQQWGSFRALLQMEQGLSPGHGGGFHLHERREGRQGGAGLDLEGEKCWLF